MKTMKKLFGIVLMLMVSMVTSADELVKFDTNEFTGGKVEKTLEEVLLPEKEGDPVFIKVTITVIPDDDYYITKEDIVVMATYPLPETPAVNTRTEGEEEKKPEFANQIELVGDDPQYLKEKRFYTFTIEKGFGVWVTEANFHQAETSGEIGTVKWSLKADEAKAEDKKLTLTLEGEGTASLDGSAPWAMQLSDIASVIIGKGVTALGADLFKGCDNLTSVEIQRDESVITLGDGAIPAGVTIDVPGNIYNMYKMNDGWKKDFKVDSENAIEMKGVKFVENKNKFDVFAASEKDKTWEIPVGVTGYSITGVQGSKILYNKVDDIKAGDVVLLFSDKIQTNDELALFTSYTEQKTPEPPAANEGNNEKSRTRVAEGEEEEKDPVIPFVLKVVKEDPDKKAEDQGLDVTLGQVYMLYNDVFYPTQAGRIPVGGIYLEEVKDENVVPKENVDKKSFARLYLTLDSAANADDAITAIDNSPLSIVHCPLSTSWYDLRGRKLNAAPTAKGVYIREGKKYVVK